MKVKLIDFNWIPMSDGTSFSETRIVGENGVTDIKGFAPRIEGDRWNYLIKYSDESVERIFNVNRVLYFGK